MKILGISAFHRDAAAALLVDGNPVAAAREERFTRVAGDPSFPVQATRFCLDRAGIQAHELDRVVHYEKPLRKFERVLATQMRAFPRSARSFAHTMFAWLGDQLWVKNRIAKELGVGTDRILFTEQQLALGANAFYTSPFESAAVVTVDDVGEWATATIGAGRGAQYEVQAEVIFPHSLGLLAAALTEFLGFVPGVDEHKVEALAGYGTPRFADALGELVQDAGGGFVVDQEPFRFSFDAEHLYRESLTLRLGPARYSGDPLAIDGADTRHADIAASLQHALEQRVLALCREAHERTSSPRLCLAGRLATNLRLNARVQADGPFAEVFVPAAPGKAGGALGAALYVHHVVEGGARPPDESVGWPAPREVDAPVDELARRLRRGEIVGWVRGEMEFGDHDVGNRCVLADASAQGAKARLLSALQHFEPYLECRVAVPAESVGEFFDPPARAATAAAMRFGVRERMRRTAPSAVSPDGTGWPLVVAEHADPDFHALLRSLENPLALIADFRLRGSPVVRTEADAVAAFERSRLDALVVGTRIYGSN